MSGLLAPLEDPAYEPEHPPVNGRIPEVVAKFGKATQLRWFARFWNEIGPLEQLSAFWCTSGHHRGPCCQACIGEHEDGYQGGGVMMDGWCCCRDKRIKGAA